MHLALKLTATPHQDSIVRIQHGEQFVEIGNRLREPRIQSKVEEPLRSSRCSSSGYSPCPGPLSEVTAASSITTTFWNCNSPWTRPHLVWRPQSYDQAWEFFLVACPRRVGGWRAGSRRLERRQKEEMGRWEDHGKEIDGKTKKLVRASLDINFAKKNARASPHLAPKKKDARARQ